MEQNTRKNFDITIDYALFCFLFCSVLGWCLEVVWRSVRHLELCIPGFLFGPYCPIYGIGMLLILVICRNSSKITAFFQIAVLMSVLEYLISFIFETAFDQLLWDYSNLPFHIGTRVCVSFSILWGILGIAAITWIEPRMKVCYFKHRKLLRRMTYAGMIIFSIDTICCIISIE